MHFYSQLASAARCRLVFALLALGFWWSTPVMAADLDACRTNYLTGRFQECIKQARLAIEDREWDEEWHILLALALHETGQYPEAHAAVSTGLSRFPSSIRLRLTGYDAYRSNGDPEGAKGLLTEINRLASSRTWAYRDVQNLVALGRAALLLGADPKQVLDNFLDPAKKAGPDRRDPWLASGDLALEKNDFALAGRIFGEAAKKFPKDADIQFGLASAFTTGDRSQMVRALDAAFNVNSNHVPSLLLLVEHCIDGEEYSEATNLLGRVLSVNPAHPDAWAYQAVIAHLRNQPLDEKRARETALKFWKNNPRVDHLIGMKLSQKYRFREGAERQRQALAFDKDYLPAKSQLAQDLLRLGQEHEGWKLADEVHNADGYDVVAYNMVTLKDSVAKFRELTNEHFIIRMNGHEADIYGAKVMDLLERARTKLCEKYGMKLEQPTTVEIFHQQKDFAVRTFGMPGGSGYLGVCFGSVITANSPASVSANWEAVLWHEFCHVVTLQMTRNKMPRWLSEGISVHEERQANPNWGEHLNPAYREMLLGEDFTPIGELSAAFLAPKSPLHLMFAYYQSSLVVDFLIERYGLDKLKLILRDLGEGQAINQTIAKHTIKLEQLEKDFAAYAKSKAEKLAPGLDWEKPPRRARRGAGFEVPDAAPTPPVSTAEWVAQRPTNFYSLTLQAQQLMMAKKWEEAKTPLRTLIKLYPGYVESDNAYSLLAEVHQQLKETKEERDVLNQLAGRSASDTDAFLRLMELGAATNDWAAVELNAQRFLAVNPLLPQPHRYLAQASEQLKRPDQAIASYRTLLQLDPTDPADVHYRLARMLHDKGDPGAKRHVLQALEEAPRFRDALRLLLEMDRAKKDQSKTTTAAP